MLTRFYESASYIVIGDEPRPPGLSHRPLHGWVKQPAEIGPVIFSNSSPTYWNLTPVEGSSDGGGISTAAIAAIAIVGAIGVALVVWFFARRRTVEERE